MGSDIIKEDRRFARIIVNFIISGSQDTSAIKKLAKETAEKKQITKVFQAEKSKKFKKKQKDRRKKKSKSN